jgi:ElaB/YqjD/DUF883 family membrane-anchored ribosome-binding protein
MSNNKTKSEKIRLGETNAWLTEQNDALRKEVLAANEVVRTQQERIERQVKRIQRLKEDAESDHESYIDNLTTQRLRGNSWKTIAVIAVIGCAVLGAILWVG